MVQNLLDLGLSGKLSAALLTEDDPAKPLLALENSQPQLLLSVEEWLLRGEENGESVCAGLRAALSQLTADRLRPTYTARLCLMLNETKSRRVWRQIDTILSHATSRTR